MEMTKRLGFVSLRFSDDETSAMRAYCAERGVTRSELIRRAVRALIAAPVDEKPGIPKPRAKSSKVARVDDHGADRLRADNGAMKR